MKKILLLLIILALFFSCNKTNNNQKTNYTIIEDSPNQTIVEITFTEFDSKTIKEFSLNIQEPLESLELIHKPLSPKSGVGNFGLAKGNEVVGWGKDAYYSANYSSEITNLTNMDKDDYKLIIEVGKIASGDGETKEQFTIIKTPYTPRWLRGTTHLHTINSDGVKTTKEVIDRAHANKFDYVFMTDHNMTGSALIKIKEAVSNGLHYAVKEHNTAIKESFAYRSKDLIIIPGVEWTSSKGHANFVGIDNALLDNKNNKTKKDANYYLHLARKNGAYVGINHPYAIAPGNSNWSWTWPNKKDYDYVEVWNKAWNADNQKNLDWWHAQLLKGEKIALVGGTDYHKDNNHDLDDESYIDPRDYFIMPINKVLASSFTQQGILESIKAGKSIAFNGNVLDDVIFTTEKGYLGVDATNETKVKIDVKNIRGDFDIVLVTENASKIIASNVVNFNAVVDVDFNKFCYLVIKSKDNDEVVALSNAIYRN